LLVDIGDKVPGVVDDETGAVALAEQDDAASYGVVDEIARRVPAHRWTCPGGTAGRPARPHAGRAILRHRV